MHGKFGTYIPNGSVSSVLERTKFQFWSGGSILWLQLHFYRHKTLWKWWESLTESQLNDTASHSDLNLSIFWRHNLSPTWQMLPPTTRWRRSNISAICSFTDHLLTFLIRRSTPSKQVQDDILNVIQCPRTFHEFSKMNQFLKKSKWVNWQQFLFGHDPAILSNIY